MRIINLLYGLCLASASACMFTSCDLLAGNNDVTYIPFRSDEDGKWGMISTDGKVLFEDEFHNIPTCVTDDRFFVQNQDGFWEMYSATEHPERIGGEMRYVTSFSNGAAMVTPRDGNISIINKKGETTAIKKFEGKTVTEASGFHGNIATLVCDTMYGVIDTKGKTILPPRYRNIDITASGLIIASDYNFMSTHGLYDTIPSQKGKKVIYDSNGKELYTLNLKKYFDIVAEGVTDRYITVYSRKLTPVTEGTGKDKYTYYEPTLSYSIIDYESKTVVNAKDETILAVNGEYYIYYTDDDKMTGVKKMDGTVVLKPEYDGINFIGSDYIAAVVSKGDEMSAKLYDMEGKQISNSTYSAIAGNSLLRTIKGTNVFVCNDNSDWNLITDKGQKIKDIPKIYALMPYSYGDDRIMSDSLNYKAFINELRITENSMGDFTFNTEPKAALNIQRKTWNYYDSKESVSKPKAADYTTQTSIYLNLTADSHYYSSEVQYPSAFSKQTFTQRKVIDYVYGNWYWYHMQKVPTGYTFNKITPSWFKLSFSSYQYYGKLRNLYKELAKYVRKWGTVEEKNPGAILMSLNNGKKLLIALNEDELIMKWGKLPKDEQWIGPYASNSEKLSAQYNGNEYMLSSYNSYVQDVGD